MEKWNSQTFWLWKFPDIESFLASLDERADSAKIIPYIFLGTTIAVDVVYREK